MVAGSNNLGTIRGTIEIDYDGAGIVKAVRDTDRLGAAGSRLNKTMTGVLSVFSKFAKGAGIMAAGSLATNSALQAVAGTLAIIGPLAAAGVAVLPGILAGAAAAGIVAKVAFMGMGDALEAAGEDATKFNEAIKDLPKNAQAFARAYRASLPALQAVQKSIQDTFFKGLDSQIPRVVGMLTSLRAQAVGIAGAMRQLIVEVIKFTTSSSTLENVRIILAGTNGFLLQLRGSVGPLIAAFAQLAAQASAFGSQAGGGVAGFLDRITTFVNNVDIGELFAKAAPIVQAFSGFLGNVTTIARELFGQIFAVDGANAAGVVGELAAKLADFLESAAGQDALAAIGTALNAISTGAGQVFLTLLQALAPAIVALSPAITSLANSVSSGLVTALNAVAGPLESVAGFISDHTGFFGPLAAIILSAAAAYKVYVGVTKAWAAAEAVAQALRLKGLATWVATTAATVAAGVAAATHRVITLAGAAATAIATVAQTAFGVALRFALGPIGLIITAVGLLVAAIVYLWKNNETFRRIVIAVWNAVKAAISAVGKWITGTLWPSLKRAFEQGKSAISAAINFVVGYFKFWLNIAKIVVNGVIAAFNLARARVIAVWNAIKSATSAVWNAIRAAVFSAINNVLAAVRRVQQVVGIVRSAFNSARNAVVTVIGSIISTVRGLPGRIVSALGSLGSRLYGAGRSLIQGFINGIKDMIGAAASAARSVVDKVTSFLPGSPAEEGPLSGRGYVLLRARRMMADFTKGILDGADWPAKAMAGVVQPVAATATVRPSTAPSGRSTPPTGDDNARTFGPYRMEFDGKVLAEFVVDAVTGRPRMIAKTATEGDRQIAWAGSGR